MSAREIAFRLQYEAFTRYERYQHRRGRLALPDRLRGALHTKVGSARDWRAALLAERAGAPCFFAGVTETLAVRDCLSTRFPMEMEKSRSIAAQVRRHELTFFGETFHLGRKISWHNDPKTGTGWPRQYHREVPVHGGDVGYGDVKYVWEVNRHQFLIDLAKCAFLDGSREHADEVTGLVGDWMDEVPYATGAPWACALEPAFRAWSWLWSYHMLRAAGLLADNEHLKWLTGFFDHGRFLHRHLERYSSPYNHLAGEASALYALGVLFPEFREAAEWRQRGRLVLESSVQNQFHSDGGTREQSTFYHHATLGFYLLSALLGRRNAEEFSSETWTSIQLALEFSAALTMPDGRLPAIGGADDGKPIRLEHLPFWDFRPYLAVGAVLFGRPDFKHVAGRFWEDALWLLGPTGLRLFDALASTAPPSARALDDSGYYVARSDWSDAADYVCFDCGPQAAGLRPDDVPSAAHGHADCLSVVVALGGVPVLVDPGFYCYNGPPAWEVHFRKTGAHNTALVDGRDQAWHVSKMAWSRTYTPQLLDWEPGGDVAWARGTHDGYEHHGTSPASHRRVVWLRDGGYVVLYDEFESDGEHELLVNFQFPPGRLEQVDHAIALLDGRFEVGWTGTTAVRATDVCGGPEPGDGWVAESLGVLRAAPRLALGMRLAGGRAALVTVIADRSRTAGAPRVSVQTGPEDRILSIRVCGLDWEDRLVASDGQPATASGVQTDALLAIARTGPDKSVQTLHVGGTFVRVHDERPGTDPVAACLTETDARAV